MKISIEERFTARWEHGSCILFGFEWSKHDDFRRHLQRSFHITVFGIDIWFRGKEKDVLIFTSNPKGQNHFYIKWPPQTTVPNLSTTN